MFSAGEDRFSHSTKEISSARSVIYLNIGMSFVLFNSDRIKRNKMEVFRCQKIR